MSSFVKYKIREVAKDFDMPTKSVMNMVTEHFEAPKSSAQVLSDDQLNLVFDLITRENQIDSVEEVFAARMQQTQDNPDLLVVEDAPAKKEQPKAENKPQQPQKNQPAANGGKRPQQGGQNNQQPRQPGGQNRPQQPQNASAQNNNNNNNNNAQSGQQPKRKKERRVVDTSRVTVNADRFDDRVDELVLRAFTSGVVARPLEPRCSRTIGLAFPKTANSVVSQTMLCYFEDWTGKMAAGETKRP